MRSYVKGNKESSLLIEYDGIRRTQFHDVITCKEKKICKPVYAKRWFRCNNISYPYGCVQ